nr:PhoD-like phosphatase N-terminal domain-containing protein [Delftia sp. GW456-R20]
MMLRRHLLLSTAAGSLLPSILRAQSAPAAITRDAARPLLPSGLQSGDVLADRAIVWARASRDARMWIEWSTTSGFANPTRVRGPDLLMDSSDGTGRIDLQGLPAGQDIFYRVVLEDFASANVRSPAVQGRFRTPLAAGMPATRPLRWCGAETPQARASASTRPLAACASTRPCAGPTPTCSCTAATPSMPTAPLPRR